MVFPARRLIRARPGTSRRPGAGDGKAPRGDFLAVPGQVLLESRNRRKVGYFHHGGVRAKPMSQHVLVTGGAGYVGAVLVPKLLSQGHRVTVVDLYIFGDQVLKAVSGHPGLRQVRGDIRDRGLLERELQGLP